MFWGRLAAVAARVPVVICAIHSTGWPDRIGRLNRLLTPVTDAFVGVAAAHGRYLIEEERFPPHRVRVIPNGVDTEVYSPRFTDGRLRRQLGIPPGPVAGVVAAQRRRTSACSSTRRHSCGRRSRRRGGSSSSATAHSAARWRTRRANWAFGRRCTSWAGGLMCRSCWPCSMRSCSARISRPTRSRSSGKTTLGRRAGRGNPCRLGPRDGTAWHWISRRSGRPGAEDGAADRRVVPSAGWPDRWERWTPPWLPADGRSIAWCAVPGTD